MEKIQKSIGLNESLWAWVQTQADRDNRSLANYIETVLERAQAEQIASDPSKIQTR